MSAVSADKYPRLSIYGPTCRLPVLCTALVMAGLGLMLSPTSSYAEGPDREPSKIVTKKDKKKEWRRHKPLIDEQLFDTRGTMVATERAPAYVSPPRTLADVLKRLGPLREIPDPDYCGSFTTTDHGQGDKPPRRFTSNDPGSVVHAYVVSQYAIFHPSIRLGDVKSGINAMKRAYRSLPRGWNGWKAVTKAGLAELYTLSGDFSAAQRELRSAIGKSNSMPGAREKTWRKSVLYRVKSTQGAVLEALGKYAQAEEMSRVTLEFGSSIGLRRWRKEWLRSDIDLQRIARVQMLQGRLSEAEASARIAVQAYGDSYPEVSSPVLITLAEVIFEQGRYEEAEELARRSLNLYESECLTLASLQVALAKRLQARAFISLGRWEEAVVAFEAIETGMRARQPGLFQSRFENDPDWGFALLKAERAHEALGKLESAYQSSLRGLGADHELTARVQAFVAMANSQTGNKQRAVSGFREAIPKLLDAWNRLTHDGAYATNRGQELRLIIEAYVELLDELSREGKEAGIGEDPVDVMFQLADIARSGSVQKALAANSARAAATDPGLSELVRRQQDAQNQVTALQNVLLTVVSQPAEEQNPEVIRKLQARIAELREAGEQLSGEVERRFPKYAALINPKPPTVEQVRGQLRVGEALIAVMVGDEQTYVWAVPKSGPVAYSSRSLGRQAIERLVGELRASLEPDVEMLSDIPTFNTEIAHRLYKELLGPVQSGWRQARSLLVVADGALRQLPFAVLPTEPVQLKRDQPPLFSEYREVPLARDYAVVNLPSVSSLVSLRGVQPQRAAQNTFAGFGDPWFSAEQATAARLDAPTQLASLDTRGLPLMLRFSPRTRDVDSAELAKLPRLPETAEEVRDMATALGADPVSSVFLGERATESQVKAMNLANRRVVAFATHGLVAGDLNGLTQPALALSSPKITGEKEDGLLTMGEVLGLKLNADWVVLSACNTASAEGAGAEAVSGLGRAFFYAGARSLLVTHWPVETTSAKALTTEVFRQQSQDATLTRGEALRRAMMKLIDGPGYVDAATGQSLFSYAHPLFWAPFALIGDGAN